MEQNKLTLGSLFDGSGGFPLGGLISGITPVWASEIEPFPIRVTTKRLPFMKHYGDVSKMNGADVEPVDIITFGSPCQDMSIAGRREGLDGSRSSLFYEAVRIVKEMRCKTGGRYPRYIVWENVPYALQRIRNIMNRNQLCVVPPKSSETEQKSPVSLHIIFGFSQARTATQSTPYPVPNEMPLEDQDELSLSPKQLAWPRYLLWRRPQW